MGENSTASSRPPVDMNNGRSNTTTGSWWVRHLAMMDHRAPPTPLPSTSGIPDPKTHVQTEVPIITESATSWVLQPILSIYYSWRDLLLFACFVFLLAFLAFLVFPLPLEAANKSGVTFFFFKDGTWLKSAPWWQNRYLESSWRQRVWVWARQLNGTQCCFAIIDFPFTKLSCNLCIYISFLT